MATKTAIGTTSIEALLKENRKYPLPKVPETAIAMLACTRIGAPHSVIFGGFAPDAIRERIHDAQSTVLLTADGGWRRGGHVPLKKNVDEALKECPDVRTVVVLKRTGQQINMQADRDIWWDDFVKEAEAYCPPEKMEAEDMRSEEHTSELQSPDHLVCRL